MATKKAIKLFEAHLGDKFYAWKADDRTDIKLYGSMVTVTQKHDEYGEVITRFELDLIPAYTLA